MNGRGGSKILRFATAVAFLAAVGGCSNWVLGVVQSFGSPNGGKISTFAGNGTGSFSGDGGAATSAEIDAPQGVAVDSAGNLYIADSGNSVIRRVAGGNISTYAGNFLLGPGYSVNSGPAINVQLYYPYGVAIDSSGNLYVADTLNNLIRKVDTKGSLTTVAGTAPPVKGGFSGDGGLAISATLDLPYGVAVDSANNIYIDDYNNNRIRMVSGSTGNISTVAGTGIAGYYGDGGPATSARISYPYGIAVDSAGNLYIADTSNNLIRKVDVSGTIITVAGNPSGSGYSGDGGPATSALLHYPAGLAVDTAGNIYIADQNNNVIRKVDTSGNISTVAGNFHLGAGYGGDGNVATAAMLNAPWGIAVDSSGNLYIADYRNNRIRKVDPGK
jgi:sugar lactone lactonase YvrE